MAGRVAGVGLQLNETFLDGVGLDALPPRDAFDYAELIVDSWAAPLDSGYVVNQNLRRLFDEVASRFPLLGHSNYGLEYGFDSLDNTPAFQRHIALAHEMESPWIADHLFYGIVNDSYLWSSPIQFSRAEIDRVAGRAAAYQDRLKIPLLHENAFYYATFPGSELEEAEFLAEVVRRAQTHLLLDLHNIYANSVDHEEYDAWRFLRTIPLDRVMEIHLAGGQWIDGWYHDLHNNPVPEPVWELLDWVVPRCDNLRAITLEYQGIGHMPRSRPIDPAWPQQVEADLRRARQIWSRHRGDAGGGAEAG